MPDKKVWVEILVGELKGYEGHVTRVTKAGIYWVRVKSKWGNHHHAGTSKTFKYKAEELHFPDPPRKLPTYDKNYRPTFGGVYPR